MYIPDTYLDAEQWLRGSKRVADRNKRRSMYWYGKELVRRSPDTIAIHVPWMNYDVAVYNSDGTMTIEVPQTLTTKYGYVYQPMHSQSVRYMLRMVAGLTNVFVRKGKLFITERDYKRTPSKIQKCRQCSGSKKLDTQCYVFWCYSGLGSEFCSKHPGEKINSSGTHLQKCEHGLTNTHTIPRGVDCYFCYATGKRDYGNNPISLMWDGSPIRIKDGNLYRKEPSELEKRIAAYVNLPD